MNREERRKAEREINVKNIRKVGQRLPGVTLGDVNRPILDQVDDIVSQVQEASEPLPEQAGHVPAIGALNTPGQWGVFCLRCSSEAKEYVWPCEIDPEDWPPRVLYEVAPSPSEV